MSLIKFLIFSSLLIHTSFSFRLLQEDFIGPLPKTSEDSNDDLEKTEKQEKQKNEGKKIFGF